MTAVAPTDSAADITHRQVLIIQSANAKNTGMTIQIINKTTSMLKNQAKPSILFFA